MVHHLYRFRSIKNLLDRHELENQEIFFAHPEALNDPAEGIKDVYWRGDVIVWTNLFKHYLVCLNTAWALLGVCKEDQPFDWKNIPIDYFHGQSLTPVQVSIHAELFQNFFKSRNVRNYIKVLASLTHPIRRNELIAHLRDLHLFAITTIHACYKRNNPAVQPVPLRIKAMLKIALSLQNKSLNGIKRSEDQVPENEYAAEIYYTKRRTVIDQLNFITLYDEKINPSHKNTYFVFVEFPETYVDQLERLVYPEWYTACFMKNCNNSSIWGNYGTNHTGVCLQFNAVTQEGKPYIGLNRICGLNTDGYIYANIEHSFYKIDYERPLVPIDFFRSLARVRIPMLQKYWYRDEKGQESPCADDMFKNEEAWRVRHWENFYKSVTRKSVDWKYEEEYRLILASEWLDFSDEKARKLKYDFSVLDGIIFGIKTSLDDKRRIRKIVEAKCRATKRDGFRFYQAFYEPQSGMIEHTELGLLKF